MTKNAQGAAAQKKLRNIFYAVAPEGEQLLDAIAVVALQLDGIALDGPATGKFSFEMLGEVFKINIRWIKPVDNGNLFPVPALVDFDIDPLLFLCYLLTDTQFFR